MYTTLRKATCSISMTQWLDRDRDKQAQDVLRNLLNLKSTVAFIITNDLLIKHCYLASACPPGQYIAQYGSGKGHNSGFSVQNRQVGVKSLKEISGVKLWPLTISVLSIIKFFISSSDLTLLTHRRIKQHIPLWKVSWPRNHWIIPLYMLMLKLVTYPPIVYISSHMSVTHAQTRLTRHWADPANQSATWKILLKFFAKKHSKISF